METALKMLAIKHENLRNLIPNDTTWTKIQVNKTLILLLNILIQTNNSLINQFTKIKHFLIIKIKETIIVLEPLEKATKNLSGSMYPTIADVRFYFTEIQDHLKFCIAASINQKIEEY